MRLSRPIASVRAISIVLGIIVGVVLAFAFQITLPTLFSSDSNLQFNIVSLVIFVAIPALAGFVVGLLHAPTAARDGLLVGFIVGIVNAVMASVKLIFVSSLIQSEVLAFALFAIMSVFIWAILAAASAEIAARIY